jgi:hypothetical protein
MALRNHHVQLEDGTGWAVDREVAGVSLEWILRYGSRDDVWEHRMAIASIVSSYMALLHKPQKRRNQVVRELQNALEEWGRVGQEPCADSGNASKEEA